MAKYIISTISLVLIIQSKANRLLQQATCTSTLCEIGTQCYDTSNGPVCCDPNICVKGSCGGNGLHNCDPGYECVAGNCPKGMTDCPGTCVNPNAQPQPQIGEPCLPCIKPACACTICPSNLGAFGCCGGCKYRDDGNGNIICVSDPITSEKDCPPVPLEGAPCGEQGIDCGRILAPQFICSDGSCYGNCGTCTYQDDGSGNLVCSPAIIPQETVCPCDAWENCASYTPDGCNTCGCPKDGSLSFCTLIACPDLMAQPECRSCRDGYTLNPITKQCELILTCASRTCLVGETCYETSNGPACCDADICQSGICGTRAGFECVKGYECVEDPLQTCDPVTTADCPGVCVDIDAVPVPVVGCGIDHCNSFFDGCNECFCKEDGTQYCTERACKQLLDPYCIGCLPGYVLNPSTNKCELSLNKCCDPNDKPGFNGNPFCFEGAACCPDGSWSCSIGDGHTFPCGEVTLDTSMDEMGTECCGGFTNCKSYYDGCNDCMCGGYGLDGCTKKLCFVNGTPKCNECEFGYKVNDENGQCVRKKSCRYNNDCDMGNGFRCRSDPICRGRRSDPLCENVPRVCFDYESRYCQSDADCDFINGFKCYGINDQGNGVCGKYE